MKFMKTIKTIIPAASLLFIAMFLSCEKENDGFNSLVDLQETAPGIDCINGGIVVKSGLDKNRNNLLDTGEVTSVKSVCNGQNGTSTPTDKQVILSAYTGGYSTSLTTGEDIYATFPDFDKNNYGNLDSIIFCATAWTYGSTALIELYNISDQVVIDNSLITATESFDNRKIRKSSNILNNLPASKKEIGVRIRSGAAGDVALGMVYLIMYKK